MADRLAEETGYRRSCAQSREKLKQLKESYKKVKDNINLSGRSRKVFIFLMDLDEIVADRPSHETTKCDGKW